MTGGKFSVMCVVYGGDIGEMDGWLASGEKLINISNPVEKIYKTTRFKTLLDSS